MPGADFCILLVKTSEILDQAEISMHQRLMPSTILPDIRSYRTGITSTPLHIPHRHPKHAISTIAPARPVELAETEG